MLTRFASGPVAATRILVGAATLLLALENLDLLRHAATDRIAIPVIPGAPGVTEPLAIAIAGLGAVGGILLAFGFLSRIAAGAASTASFAALLVEQQAYSSHQVLTALVCLYLVFADPGARFSFDSLLRGAPRATVPRVPVLLILTQVSVVYFFAAISKLNPVYLAGDVMASSLIVPVPEQVSIALACCSIALELFLAIGLWVRRTASVAVVLGFGFHFVIAATLNDPFALWAFGLVIVSAYPLFVTRDPVLAARWAARYRWARSTSIGG